MSGLRLSFLEFIRIAGNNSGCHQLPERSFFYHGKQFPVCARCCGVFLGHIAAVILFFADRLPPLRICCLMMGVMGLDWGIQAAGVKESTNVRRLLTGFAGGLGLFCIYGTAVRRVYGILKMKIK